MKPVNYDNPAARLLAILEKGKQISAEYKCRSAWQQILEVKDNNALLISRLGKIMELPDQTIKAIKDSFPNQGNTWGHWSNQVNHAFMVQNLNDKWAGFIGHIDDHTITYLRLASDLLQSKTNAKIIAYSDLQELKEKIRNIYDEVIKSEIDDEVKKYLAHYLQKILIEIDEYHLTGALPLLETVEIMTGHAAIDKNYYDFLKDTELGKRILDTLGAMANMVTIAIGIPQLTQTILLLSS